jgi:beta-phosphoglucomutase-like phosphatase (HAD superfamily)
LIHYRLLCTLTVDRSTTGVILESEDLHQEAFNAAFQHFDVRCPDVDGGGVVTWGRELYDDLQNRVGGGKFKMRDYFGEYTNDVTV